MLRFEHFTRKRWLQKKKINRRLYIKGMCTCCSWRVHPYALVAPFRCHRMHHCCRQTRMQLQQGPSVLATSTPKKALCDSCCHLQKSCASTSIVGHLYCALVGLLAGRHAKRPTGHSSCVPLAKHGLFDMYCAMLCLQEDCPVWEQVHNSC